jgi:FtsH-binding integral membrane protein
MAIGPEHRTVYRTAAQDEALSIDQGLRSYMLGVYNYVGGGLLVSAVLAYLFAFTPALHSLVYTMRDTQFGPQVTYSLLGWVALFAPIGLLLWMQFQIRTMAVGTVQALYWVFTALMGISLSSLALRYTGESIGQAFVVTAATFLGMSLYGYTTKRDLTGIGSFLTMGVWGLIVASLVSFFLASSALVFAISVAGVVIFTGLTAYHTQAIKWTYASGDGREVTVKKSIMGAIALYLDFINLLQFMLMLFGNRR